jgi:hypothetical protein
MKIVEKKCKNCLYYKEIASGIFAINNPRSRGECQIAELKKMVWGDGVCQNHERKEL